MKLNKKLIETASIVIFWLTVIFMLYPFWHLVSDNAIYTRNFDWIDVIGLIEVGILASYVTVCVVVFTVAMILAIWLKISEAYKDKVV